MSSNRKCVAATFNGSRGTTGSQMSELKGKRGIAAYLKERVGQIVHTKELYEASGRQSEYTRRIRELRDEDGWRIETRRDVDDLRPDEYRLAEPPPEKSHMRFQRNINAKLRAQVLDRKRLYLSNVWRSSRRCGCQWS